MFQHAKKDVKKTVQNDCRKNSESQGVFSLYISPTCFHDVSCMVLNCGAFSPRDVRIDCVRRDALILCRAPPSSEVSELIFLLRKRIDMKRC